MIFILKLNSTNKFKKSIFILAGKTIDTIRQEKFQQIIQRRKLVDLAKAQAQEVAFLRSEVERLRMKTFPALVQIEF